MSKLIESLIDKLVETEDFGLDDFASGLGFDDDEEKVVWRDPAAEDDLNPELYILGIHDDFGTTAKELEKALFALDPTKYSSFSDFFNDNPDAVETLYDWISENMRRSENAHWRKNMGLEGD